MKSETLVSRCVRCVQQVKQEYYLVKNKLETLFAVSRIV